MPGKYYRVCSHEGCTRPHYAKNLCALHYKRLHRGDSIHDTVELRKFYLPRPLLAALDRVAARTKATRNRIIRGLIADYLEREGESVEL